MPQPFLTSSSTGVETPWQSLEDLLDALEQGFLDADDYVFDQIRQAWQPIRRHDGIVRAWDQRMSYRPPELRRIITTARRPSTGFPALSPDGHTPLATPIARLDTRRRPAPSLEEVPEVRRMVLMGEVLLITVLVSLLALGFVWIVRGMLGAIR